MTTTTHTTIALLAVAVAALEAQNTAHKKETGAPLFALGHDMGNGVKWRELKAWAKEFKAKQKEVTPAPKDAKPAAKAETKVAPVGNVRDLELTNSSNIESATYDRDNKALRVTFKTGAVYEYANVGIREANNFEKAESAGKFFGEFIKGVKDTTKIKAADSKTPAPKADAKPAAKEPKPAAAAVEYKASELRGAPLLNGRKLEEIAKVVTNKTTGEREVITATGNRYTVSSLRKNNRGKFVVEAATPAPKADTKPATAEQTVKTTRNRRANFVEAKEEANNTRKAKPLPEAPKSSDVKGAEVRVIKGSKDKMVKIQRVVNRDGIRYAITESRFALPFGQIIFNDDVLTYTGKLTAEEFRAA